MSKIEELQSDIAEVLNRHGVDSQCNTPDFILAKAVVTYLASVKVLLAERHHNGDKV